MCFDANASSATEIIAGNESNPNRLEKPSIYQKKDQFQFQHYLKMSALRSKLFHSRMQFTKAVAQRLGYIRRLVVQQSRDRC